MIKILSLVGVSVILIIAALLYFFGPTTQPGDSLNVISEPRFKEVSLGLQPITKPEPDRPTQVKSHLLYLLKSAKYVELDKAIEKEALKFDEGKLSEPSFDNILDNLAQVDPELELQIINWIDSSKSWAAYMVASRYFDTLAWQWRGKSYWSAVPQKNRQKFKSYQELSRAVLEMAKQNNDRDVLWYSDKIELANQSSDTDELPLIKQALKSFPDSILVHHSSIHAQSSKWGGDEYFRQELIHGYAKILDKEKYDGGPTVHFYTAKDAASAKDYVGSINEIRTAITRNPNRLHYYSVLAKSYYKTKQYPLALAAINTTLEHRQYRIDDLLLRANILLEADLPKKALKDLETILSFSPMHKEANTKAFSTHAKLGNRDKALIYLEAAGYFTQDNARELARQGYFAKHDLKDLDIAQTYYKRALEINPQLVSAHYQYATIYAEQESCQIVNHLYSYLKSCASSKNHDGYWCKPRHKNWVISSVNHMQNHKQCPEVEEYNFEEIL